jgi:type IV pilus assembly protein PilW
VLTMEPLDDTDIVSFRSAGGSGIEVVLNNSDEQVFVANTGSENDGCAVGTDKVSGLCPGDILMVTDCTKARIFQATAVTTPVAGMVSLTHVAAGAPGNAHDKWGGVDAPVNETFGPGAEVIVAINSTYFIAPGAGVLARPSLWQDINGTPVELLEGVEDMAISYGVDTDAEFDYVPNDYISAKQVEDGALWGRVVSIEIELLVASIEDNVLPEVQLYDFDDEEDIDPEDRRLRQVFTTVVGIRSRLN